MDNEELKAVFSGYLTQCHAQLFAYVHSLVRDLNDVEDVMQKTTIVLWGKFSTFDRSRPFYAWACGVARLEAMNFLRKSARDPHCFSDRLAESIGQEFSDRNAWLIEQTDALAGCLEKLTQREKDLVDRCYSGLHTIQEVANEMSRTTHSIYNSLRRIRRNLFECVGRSINESGLNSDLGT